ncbi:MAG: N-acetylmuramoyl-L-alanine amidase [Candidatus Eremiobacteraeota bacterium]|nr:N-acetylmuramoyl-L-alanine amidase [Candidatus Eremiobacteraeota bacterium]
MKTLLSLLLLTGVGWAEPQIFPAAEPVQGRVLLVAEDGQKEAEALARAGIETLLSHAKTSEEFGEDWQWAQERYGLEATETVQPGGQVNVTFSLKQPVSLIALGPKAPIVWPTQVDGAVFIDQNPNPASYPPPKRGPFDLAGALPVDAPPKGLAAIPYERDLKPYQALFLVPPTTSDEVCKQLQGNVHKTTGSLAEDNSALQKEVRRWIAIQQPLSPIGLPDTKFVASPNWGVRSVGDKIDTVVVHSTVINTLEGTERAFWDDKERRVSAHYVVDRDGTTIQMVDERRTAWHAGVSELDGRTGVNDFSVGIELVNLNDGKDPYPEAQVLAVKRIIQDLRERWDVPDSHIVSHAAIARPVGRKSDPVGFDFEGLLRLLKD